MRHYAVPVAASAVPGRPLRVLVEDAGAIPERITGARGVEVVVCAGPQEGEVCPLVMDGECPFEPCDVVVNGLTGEWARSIRAAWAERSTPTVDGSGLLAADPDDRLAHHVGAAIKAVVEGRTVTDEG